MLRASIHIPDFLTFDEQKDPLVLMEWLTAPLPKNLGARSVRHEVNMTGTKEEVAPGFALAGQSKPLSLRESGGYGRRELLIIRANSRGR